MAKPISVNTMSEYLPKEVGLLRAELERLPQSVRDRMLPLCDKICHFIGLQGRLFEMAQESADRMQLEVKYLLFDLDCTRGEREALREELENLTEGW